MNKNEKRKYVYDYPQQREIAKYLLSDDKAMICEKTGYSYTYMNDWCHGRRKNIKFMELAIKFAKINKEIELVKEQIMINGEYYALINENTVLIKEKANPDSL